MTGSLAAVIVIPIVVALGLTVWLVAIFRARGRPAAEDQGGEPGQPISGGVFQGDPRQQMPRRDAPASGSDAPASGSDANAAR